MWTLALDDKSADTPSIFALSRQPVSLLAGSDRAKVHRGAYTVWSTGNEDEPELTIIGTGAEVGRAIETAEKLTTVQNVRVVSMPSQRHFDAQDSDYRRSVVPSGKSLVVAIEAWASYGWAKYAHASLSMQSFVSSAIDHHAPFVEHSPDSSISCRAIPHPKTSFTTTLDSIRRTWRARSMPGQHDGEQNRACQASEISKSFCLGSTNIDEGDSSKTVVDLSCRGYIQYRHHRVSMSARIVASNSLYTLKTRPVSEPLRQPSDHSVSNSVPWSGPSAYVEPKLKMLELANHHLSSRCMGREKEGNICDIEKKIEILFMKASSDRL
jgi:hypothetical protein